MQLAELEIVDPRQADAMAQIAAVQPSVMILHSTDSGVTQFCSPSQLLLLPPGPKSIYLDQKQAQVVTSVRHPATKVHDWVQTIVQTA